MRWTWVVAVAVLGGCASQPQTSAPPAPVAAAEAAPAPAAEATASSKPVEQVQTSQAAAAAFKPPSGYKQKKLGANTVYCKKDTLLGSRFPTEFCFTEDELKEIERRGEDMRLNKQKQSQVCAGGGCNN